MKNFNKILMMIFSLAFLMFACNGDDVISNEKIKEDPYLKYESATDFWFPNQAGDTTVKVIDVNGAYFATVAEGGEWCTVPEIDVYSFKIRYAEHKKSEDRTTKITLSLDGVNDIVINVGQRGPTPVLVTDSSKYTVITDPTDGAKSLEVFFAYTGNDTIVPITTVNGDYNVEVEADNAWCNVVNKTEAGFGLSIPMNNGLTREAKVTASLTYRDSTMRFVFVVKQAPMPIRLKLPEEGTEIGTTNSAFSRNFSWEKTEGIPNYSIAVSPNSAFPDDETSVINVGDADNYSLSIGDISKAMAASYAIKVPLYWKVMPTDPETDVATETKMFYVERTYASTLFPLTLNGGDSSWTGLATNPDGSFRMNIGGGRSSRRTYMAINPLTESIPEGKVVVVAYEYKTSEVPGDYADDVVTVRHCPDGWNWDANITNCQITNEWLPNVAPLRTTGNGWGRNNWGNEGDKFYFFITPLNVTTADQIANMGFNFRNIRLEVYE
jgi:hypothetical protein